MKRKPKIEMSENGHTRIYRVKLKKRPKPKNLKDFVNVKFLGEPWKEMTDIERERDALKEYRKKREISQAAFAKELGVSLRTLQGWESNHWPTGLGRRMLLERIGYGRRRKNN